MSERIWVVEMLCNGKWEPTVGVALVKKDSCVPHGPDTGFSVLDDWKTRSPCDKFRLRAYVRREP